MSQLLSARVQRCIDLTGKMTRQNTINSDILITHDRDLLYIQTFYLAYSKPTTYK